MKRAMKKRKYVRPGRPDPWAVECLDMIRETLEAFGLPMEGCPPMMYNDAVRQLVGIVAREAGLKTGWDVVRVVAEHEAARSHLFAIPGMAGAPPDLERKP